MPEGYSRLSTIIPADLHKRVKIAAITHDRALQDVIAEALADWLKKNG
ncbi:MAG: hypothetical protein WCP28_08750 [Actinomycetes bacterium]